MGSSPVVMVCDRILFTINTIELVVYTFFVKHFREFFYLFHLKCRKEKLIADLCYGKWVVLGKINRRLTLINTDGKLEKRNICVYLRALSEAGGLGKEKITAD